MNIKHVTFLLVGIPLSLFFIWMIACQIDNKHKFVNNDEGMFDMLLLFTAFIMVTVFGFFSLVCQSIETLWALCCLIPLMVVSPLMSYGLFNLLVYGY